MGNSAKNKEALEGVNVEGGQQCGDMGWNTGWDRALPADPAPRSALMSLAVWRGQSRFSPEAQRRRRLGRGRGHQGWAELAVGL